MDILLETNPISPNYHDAVWINGPLTKDGVTFQYVDTVAQRLKIRLLTFQEEWFLDTTYGVPYFQRILGKKKVTKSSIDIIFQEQILLEPGVKELVEFNSTFSDRQYSVKFKVRVVTGDVSSVISINPTN